MKSKEEIMEWTDPDNEVSDSQKVDIIIELLVDIRDCIHTLGEE